nr:glycosyltransferase [Pseudactinotalea sp. HY160]
MTVATEARKLPWWKDDALVAAYITTADLTLTGSTQQDTAEVARAVLAEADRALATGDLEEAAVHAALALDVLFHRELHSDVISTPLVESPVEFLTPLRASAVGRLLTTSTTARSPRGAGARNWLQIKISPGPFGEFYRPVAKALEQADHVAVEVLELRDRRLGLANMTMDPSFVLARLHHASGTSVVGHDEAVAQFANADVIFADWADKSALLASMCAPANARLTIRVHSVDLLRPWLHLIDWSRVDQLIFVNSALADLGRDMLADRLAGVALHVLPNLIEPERFDREKSAEAERTLCMVGWAQRVKDPLWTLEVLARLVATDESWRLMLVGADFPDRPTASGARYANEFRTRAMADDIRDHIEYVGYTDDLPAVLCRAGYAVNSSVREAWGVGLAETIASGAVPIVRDWPMMRRRGGAAAVFPSEWIVQDVDEAVARIRSFDGSGPWARAAAAARNEIGAIADPSGTAEEFRAVVIGPAARLVGLIAAAKDEEARALIDDELAAPGASVHLLSRIIRATRTLGDVDRQLTALDQLLELKPDATLEAGRRMLVGRIRETDNGWEPAITRPTRCIEPVAGMILHVLKASRPYRETGYAIRSWYTLHEQRRIGLDAIGVTALDFPSLPASAEASVSLLEDVDGVPHYRLIRGIEPESEPVDTYLDAWADALAEQVEFVRPSIIHVHSGHRGYEGALVALSVGRRFGIPVVYEVRGFFESLWGATAGRAEAGQIYERRLATEKRCMQAAGAVVTLSESMRSNIIDRGIDPATVHVVPNAVDPEAFPPRPRSPRLVDQHGLAGHFVFGYVSNLDHPREGHEYLVRAALELRRRGVPATALIVGDGRRRDELEEFTRNLGAQDAVVFTGRIPHERIQDYYALLDVFVIPRIDERAARLVTPLKPYEAMALGIPLVVSDLEALQEVIGAGERGASFAAGDATSLVEVLLWAFRNPDALRARAERARAWVVTERTWKANAVAYRAVYRELTGW